MGVKKLIKRVINKLPYCSSIYEDNQLYKKNACYPPGHFYSPIVSVEDIKIRERNIWEYDSDLIYDIDLKVTEQLNLLKMFERYYTQIPFKENKQEGLRYYFKNDYYSYTDGIILYSFIRHFNPKQIIEIGSGYSSALMLDTNECFCNNNISLTFIEPLPDRLKSLIKESDDGNCIIIEKPVQDVQVNIFSNLDDGDILFIDSSHVSKTGSDVNYLLFNIIPKLKKGVIIHFHDIFYPFEYTKEWVFGGRNWNEVYLLKAFLMNNNQYEILFFSHYMHQKYTEVFKNMPLVYNDLGCNLWIRKM